MANTRWPTSRSLELPTAIGCNISCIVGSITDDGWRQCREALRLEQLQVL